MVSGENDVSISLSPLRQLDHQQILVLVYVRIAESCFQVSQYSYDYRQLSSSCLSFLLGGYLECCASSRVIWKEKNCTQQVLQWDLILLCRAELNWMLHPSHWRPIGGGPPVTVGGKSIINSARSWGQEVLSGLPKASEAGRTDVYLTYEQVTAQQPHCEL